MSTYSATKVDGPGVPTEKFLLLAYQSGSVKIIYHVDRYDEAAIEYCENFTSVFDYENLFVAVWKEGYLPKVFEIRVESIPAFSARKVTG